jgi:hypothetical protein
VRQCEWGSNSLAALFAQPLNAASPAFIRMLSELPAFQRDVLRRAAMHRMTHARTYARTHALLPAAC